MDIFSHFLWSGLFFKIVNLKRRIKKKYNFWIGGFFGIFPDFFAFTIPFLWASFLFLNGTISFGNFPDIRAIEPASPTFPMYLLANTLYNFSHSLIVFLIIFLAAGIILKEKAIYLIGWLLHILIDIPTHSYRFFPTPLFWPISNWKFDGISWGQPWFLVLNCCLLILAYTLFFYYEKKHKS